MQNDLNETLENIDKSLAENAIPKAAPTQHAIHQPPPTVPTVPITALHVDQFSARDIQRIFENIIDFVLILDRDSPLGFIVTELPHGFYFTLRCTECDFMFYDTEFPIEHAYQHADTYNHSVDCCVHAGERAQVTVTVLPTIPEKPSFSERLNQQAYRCYQSKWYGLCCSFFIGVSSYYTVSGAGVLPRWCNLIALGCWVYNFYSWFKIDKR